MSADRNNTFHPHQQNDNLNRNTCQNADQKYVEFDGTDRFRTENIPESRHDYTDAASRKNNPHLILHDMIRKLNSVFDKMTKIETA